MIHDAPACLCLDRRQAVAEAFDILNLAGGSTVLDLTVPVDNGILFLVVPAPGIIVEEERHPFHAGRKFRNEGPRFLIDEHIFIAFRQQKALCPQELYAIIGKIDDLGPVNHAEDALS